MKKFLAIATTIILMSNGQSYAAEKISGEQSENVKKVQISKENDAGKKFKAQILELEKEMEELKKQKTSANVPSMEEINEKIFELNEQEKKGEKNFKVDRTTGKIGKRKKYFS